MKPISVTDHLVSNTSFLVEYDKDFYAWKTIPELTEAELQAYYPDEGYASHEDRATSLKTALYLWIKNRNIKTKLGWISQHLSKGALLDFGAGNGAFALAAQRQGWDVSVYESTPNASAILQKTALQMVDKNLPPDSYDVITLWHVFEHLNTPLDALTQFYNALKPGGVLVLAVPNIDSWDAKHYTADWAALDVPRHRWHYGKRAIAQLALLTGFELFKIHNMFWDAFYISLLSEQYRKAKAPWANALYKGVCSNLKGWRNKNTSSLTFFLQKPK